MVESIRGEVEIVVALVDGVDVEGGGGRGGGTEIGRASCRERVL